MDSVEDIFHVLKIIKPKMRVTKAGEVRRGPHCPITALGADLRISGASDAGDYFDVAKAFGLDMDLENASDAREEVTDFVEAADHKLTDLDNSRQKEYRRRIFKVLDLPKEKM